MTRVWTHADVTVQNVSYDTMGTPLKFVCVCVYIYIYIHKQINVAEAEWY